MVKHNTTVEFVHSFVADGKVAIVMVEKDRFNNEAVTMLKFRPEDIWKLAIDKTKEAIYG